MLFKHAVGTEGKKGEYEALGVLICPEVLSTDLIQCEDRSCYGPTSSLSLVSAMVAAKAGTPALHNICKSLSVPCSTQAIKD